MLPPSMFFHYHLALCVCGFLLCVGCYSFHVCPLMFPAVIPPPFFVLQYHMIHSNRECLTVFRCLTVTPRFLTTTQPLPGLAQTSPVSLKNYGTDEV